MSHTAQIYRFFVVGCIVAALMGGQIIHSQPLFAQGDNAAVQQLAQAINQSRADAGLAPLVVHPLLNQAAQSHVDDMIANHLYSHQGSDGSFVRQRVQQTGYAAGGFASENWVSANDVDGGMHWWMNDWIHRENILNPKWQEVGIGVGNDPTGGVILVTVFTAGQNPSAENTASAPANPPKVLTVPPEGSDYTIQAGDTLLDIALRYGLDWVMIAEANHLSSHTLLQIGQVIRLPGVQAGNQPANAKTQDAQPNAPLPSSQSSSSPASSNSQKYKVAAGDTLLGIALKYKLSWQEVANANQLGEHDILQIGQDLVIPTAAKPTAETAASAPAAHLYTVAAGDTVISIALHFKLDWQTLLRLNGLNESSTLQIGQQLRLD
jgi:LysM repeat protein